METSSLRAESAALSFRRPVLRSLGTAAAVITVAHAIAWWRLGHATGVIVSTLVTLVVLGVCADRLSRSLDDVDQATSLLDAFLRRGAVPAKLHVGLPGLAADVVRHADAERARADELAGRAILDEATGLPNRLGAFDRLEQSAALAERDGSSAFVALVAIDDVAIVTDDPERRRTAENAMWVASSRAVATLRLADWCARWSDHELLAVFRTEPATCWVVAERLRAALITPTRLTGADDVELPGLPVSIGVAKLTAEIGVTVRNAESALREARTSGGNQVRVSTVAVELS
jgi:diguanylate cyclase (GGDEF)-like protein